MFSPTRDQSRRAFIGAWRRFRDGAALSDMDRRIAGIVAMHPEYHALLDEGDRNLDREWTPEGGAMNPFLHLSLHLAIAEQLAIDQPPGIRAHFDRLTNARGDEHAALHAVLECLGETLWQAQRTGSGPDATLYLGCLARQR
ncbi:MAG: DUF1841 family protein [Burkholderiales bacterium]